MKTFGKMPWNEHMETDSIFTTNFWDFKNYISHGKYIYFILNVCVQVKVMADGGQGFLKVCMSILHEDDEDNTEHEEEGSRATYKSGGIATKKGGGKSFLTYMKVKEMVVLLYQQNYM